VIVVIIPELRREFWHVTLVRDELMNYIRNHYPGFLTTTHGCDGVGECNVASFYLVGFGKCRSYQQRPVYHSNSWNLLKIYSINRIKVSFYLGISISFWSVASCYF
jgi:hypothetical protein